MIYLDNAATTAPDSEVLEYMTEVMKVYYGNPSSVHALGRSSKVLIEDSRAMIAELIGTDPSEIYFTSSATEAITTAIYGVVSSLGIKNIITSPVEHHAVGHAIDSVRKIFPATVSFLRVDKNANIDIEQLEELVEKDKNSMVILMFANNETGTIYPIEKISGVCRHYGVLLLSDMVQGFGKYPIRLDKNAPDISCCAAHKFHGPKGIGFLYLSGKIKIRPLISGGGQERNMRSGTENIYGIAGMAKAFEVAYQDMEINTKNISGLKKYFVEEIKLHFPQAIFNASSDSMGLYNMVNLSFPDVYNNKMLLQKLDMHHIAVSGGSACSSGANAVSHVLAAIHTDTSIPALRFSLGKYNTISDIQKTIEVLKKILLSK